MFRSHTTALAVLATAAAGIGFDVSSAVAAPLGLTSANLVGPTAGGEYTGETILTGFTTAEGSYAVVTGATLVTLSQLPTDSPDDDIYEPYEPYWKGTAPVSATAALVGTRVDDGLLNFEGTIDGQFGRTITSADTLFLIDVGPSSDDDVTIQLVDAAGERVGDFVLSLTESQFGGTLGILDTPSTTPDFSGGDIPDQAFVGVAFTLADFLGTGTPTGVTGLRLIDAGSLDPAAFGVAAIPEPASLGTLALGLLALRRRR